MKISEAEVDFYRELRINLERSPMTISGYYFTLAIFKKEFGDLEVEEITKEVVLKWKEGMMTRGLADNSKCAMLNRLRVFLEYCKQEGMGVIDVGVIHTPRVKQKEVVFLNEEEVRRFTESFNTDTLRGLRNRTIVETLLGTGMRIGECLSLNRDSVKDGKADIVGKGNKPRTVYFSPKALEWIERYLATRIDSDPALFVTMEDHHRLDKSGVEAFFRRHAKKIGVSIHLTPHILRHTYASNVSNHGAPLNQVQKQLGHSNIKITADYYLGAGEKEMKNLAGFLSY